jgi:hypothetical protein
VQANPPPQQSEAIMWNPEAIPDRTQTGGAIPNIEATTAMVVPDTCKTSLVSAAALGGDIRKRKNLKLRDLRTTTR